MSTITIRMQDTKHERLRRYAKEQGISLNKLFNEVSTVLLTQFDAQTRFKARALKGSPKRGLEILDELDEKL